MFKAVCARSRDPHKISALSQRVAAVRGLVFLLLAVGLPLGNRFHEISGVVVAAQGQQSRHGSQEDVEDDNGPPLICRDSVREGSAGVQRCSDMAPLGLR